MAGLDPAGVEYHAKRLSANADDLRQIAHRIEAIMDRLRVPRFEPYYGGGPGPVVTRPLPTSQTPDIWAPPMERREPLLRMSDSAERLSEFLLRKAMEMETAAAADFGFGSLTERGGPGLVIGPQEGIADLVADLVRLMQALLDYMMSALGGTPSDDLDNFVWARSFVFSMYIARITALLLNLDKSEKPDEDGTKKDTDDRKVGDPGTDANQDSAEKAGGGGSGGGGSGGGGSGGGGSGGGGRGSGGGGGGGRAGGGGGSGGGGYGGASPAYAEPDPAAEEAPTSTGDKAAAAALLGSGVTAGAGALAGINKRAADGFTEGAARTSGADSVHRAEKARYVGRTDGSSGGAGEFLGSASAKEDGGAVSGRVVWAKSEPGDGSTSTISKRAGDQWDDGSQTISNARASAGNDVDEAWEAGLAGVAGGILDKVAQLVGL